MNNAQAALAAAALVHQKVAAGSGVAIGGQSYRSAEQGKIKVDVSSDEQVLATADKFYKWLQEHGSDLSI